MLVVVECKWKLQREIVAELNPARLGGDVGAALGEVGEAGVGVVVGHGAAGGRRASTIEAELQHDSIVDLGVDVIGHGFCALTSSGGGGAPGAGADAVR